MRAVDTDPAHETVSRFFAHMAAGEWDAMAACVAPDVVRVGPFRDVKQGRDDYRDFLAETISALEGYHLDVQRIWTDGERATSFARKIQFLARHNGSS